MDENVIKIIKCGANGSWSIVSDYESKGFHIRECTVELRVHYIVDIQTDTPSVKKKYSIVRTYYEDNILYEDPLWEDVSLQERDIIGFDPSDIALPMAKGRISGIKIMDIVHYISLQAYIIYKEDPSFDNEI